MLIFNDKFTWEGPVSEGENLWLRSCHLWVIDLSVNDPNLFHLKPVIVIAYDQSCGLKRKICAETLGKQVFLDFNLDIKRTLWVEYTPDSKETLWVASFTPKYHDGSEMIYTINWRKPLLAEKEIICSHIPEIC